MTALEIAANAVNTASIVLAARNSVHTWWTGILGCLLFGFLFHGERLYADMLLQGFFVATSILGWFHWVARQGRAAHGVRNIAGVALLPWVAVAVLVALAYGTALWAWTDAVAPYPDSAVLAFSALAQLLLMRRYVQTWPLWLVVNTLAVPLFASRGLWLTATLYAGYWCNAWYGWAQWRRLARQAQAHA